MRPSPVAALGLCALLLVPGAVVLGALGGPEALDPAPGTQASWTVASSQLDTTGQPVLTGTAGLGASEAYLVLSGGAGLHTLAIRADEVVLTEVNESRVVAPNPAGGPVTYSQRTAEREIQLSNASVVADASHDAEVVVNFTQVRLTDPPDRLVLPSPGKRQGAPVCEGQRPECRWRYTFPLAVDWVSPQAMTQVTLFFDGVGMGRFLDGVHVEARGEEASYDGSSGPKEDTTSGPTLREERTYLYLRTPSGRARVDLGSTQAILGLALPRAHGAQSLVLPSASGTLEVGGEVIRLDGDRLELEGNLTTGVLGRPSGPAGAPLEQGSRLEVWGQAHTVLIDGTAYAPREQALPELSLVAAWVLLLGALVARWRASIALTLGRLYTRLTREELLDNDRRAEIVELVAAHPGIHFRGLARATGLAPGALQHHVHLLEDQGVICSTRTSGRRVFFPPGEGDGLAAKQSSLLENETRRDILSLTRDRAWTQKQLASELEVAQSTLSYHLGRLEAVGLVEVQDGMPKVYTATGQPASNRDNRREPRGPTGKPASA